MNQEQINQLLEKLLLSPKGRNYLNHLVRAYLPTKNVIKIFEKPSGTPFKCALSSDKLSTFEEIIKEVYPERFRNDLTIFWNELFKNNTPPVREDDILSENFISKNIGITGTKTNSFMSYKTYLQFYTWIYNKIKSNDKHICWITRKMLLKPIKTEDENKTVLVSTFRLGETESFKKLSQKLYF